MKILSYFKKTNWISASLLNGTAKYTRGMSKTRSLVERHCLSSLSMEALEPAGKRYRITIEYKYSDHLD